MRILPDNPNLDYLRQEAKELLTALRAADAMVQLADAQRFGRRAVRIRAWPDLKAEVERRRAASGPSDPGPGR